MACSRDGFLALEPAGKLRGGLQQDSGADRGCGFLL